MMPVVISHQADFVAFSLYFIVGFQDIFFQPQIALHTGLFTFTYAAILLLVGIPAYAEESSSSMDDEEDVEDNPRSADISNPHSWAHSMLALMQNLQRTIAASHNLLEVIIAQMLIANVNETVRSSIPVGDRCSNLKFGEESDSLCFPMRLACDFQTMNSNKYNNLYYSTLLLTIVVFAHAAIFGRALHTYCTISRCYLSFIVLTGMVHIFHFLGANSNQEVSTRKPVSNEFSNNSSDTLRPIFAKLVPSALDSCFNSLGLSTFSISIIGSMAGRKVKRHFVFMAFAVCVANLGFLVGFSIVNALRTWVILSKCSVGERQYIVGEFHSHGGVTQNEGFSARLRSNMLFLATVESLKLLNETSGHIPWAAFLPMKILFIFFLLRIASYFLLTDLQNAIAFKNRMWCILLTSVLRMALLIVFTLFTLNGDWIISASYMKTSANISFMIVKLIESAKIRRHGGFKGYFERKRSLLPNDSSIQLFLYDWFIVPGISYLFHVGYLLMLVAYVALYHELVFNWSFVLYYGSANVIPTVLIAIVAHKREEK